jgi:hypothetical protein
MDKFVSKRPRLDPETSLNKVRYYVFSAYTLRFQFIKKITLLM